MFALMEVQHFLFRVFLVANKTALYYSASPLSPIWEPSWAQITDING
jgi:hypothetical protein